MTILGVLLIEKRSSLHTSPLLCTSQDLGGYPNLLITNRLPGVTGRTMGYSASEDRKRSPVPQFLCVAEPLPDSQASGKQISIVSES